MQGLLSCTVCSSIGEHATENCPRNVQTDFNAEGEVVMRDHRGEYNELDLLWTHPSTGNRLYLGNITASKNVTNLESLQITHIVNCMARNRDKTIEEAFEYFRFPVRAHPHLTVLSFYTTRWKPGKAKWCARSL